MFDGTHAFSSFAVNDIAAARSFYADTLGLGVRNATPSDRGPIWLGVGAEPGILVYPKPEHLPASFTVLNFPVDDIADAVDKLVSRGVRIERYPGYDADERGVHHASGHSIAWFTDPAGNGLSVVQEHGG